MAGVTWDPKTGRMISFTTGGGTVALVMTVKSGIPTQARATAHLPTPPSAPPMLGKRRSARRERS
jgi:hypothetical protein